MNLDDALAEVERELNHDFIQDVEDRRLFFITGWGNVLRPAVKNHLTDHPLVKEVSVEGPVVRVVMEDLH